MKFLIRWLVTSGALFAAAYVVPGIRVTDPAAWKVYILMAPVLGLVNALVRPLLSVLSCPLIILTLGVFVLGDQRDLFSAGSTHRRIIGHRFLRG